MSPIRYDCVAEGRCRMKRNAGNERALNKGALAFATGPVSRTISAVVRLLRRYLPAPPRAETMLLFGGLAGCLGIIAAAGFLAFHLRVRAIEEQEARLTSNAPILAAHVDGLLQAVELVQTDLIRTMQDAGFISQQQYAAVMSSEKNHKILSDMVR